MVVITESALCLASTLMLHVSGEQDIFQLLPMFVYLSNLKAEWQKYTS